MTSQELREQAIRQFDEFLSLCNTAAGVMEQLEDEVKALRFLSDDGVLDTHLMTGEELQKEIDRRLNLAARLLQRLMPVEETGFYIAVWGTKQDFRGGITNLANGPLAVAGGLRHVADGLEECARKNAANQAPRKE